MLHQIFLNPQKILKSHIVPENKKLFLLILKFRGNNGIGPQFIQAATTTIPTMVEISKTQNEA